MYYIYLNDSSGPVKREIEPIASTTESSIVIGGLDPSQMYTLAIAVATNDGKLVGRVSETGKCIQTVFRAVKLLNKGLYTT